MSFDQIPVVDAKNFKKFDDLVIYVCKLGLALQFGAVKIKNFHIKNKTTLKGTVKETVKHINNINGGQGTLPTRKMIVEKKAPGVHLLKLMETPDLTIDQYFAGMSNDLAFDTDYWGNLDKGLYNKMWYANDVPGGIMTEPDSMIGPLLRIHRELAADEGTDIPDLEGVSTPMLYIGRPGSSFAWHKEDCDLYALNVLLQGSKKKWYAVAAKDMEKLLKLCEQLYPKECDDCPDAIRHKDFIINPQVLVNAGIPVAETDQEVGDMILSFPGAAHGGYNAGCNLAEALNYADVNWVPYGIDASYQCLCMDNNLDAGKLQPKRLYQLYLESKDEEYEKAFYQPYFIPSKESRRQKEILEGREKYEKKALDFMRSQKQTLPGECRVKDFNEGLVEYQNKMFRMKGEQRQRHLKIFNCVCRSTNQTYPCFINCSGKIRIQLEGETARVLDFQEHQPGTR